MKKKNPATSDSKKSFEIFRNALSIGWHLNKIMDLEPDILKDKESWDRFVKWLERHKVKY